MTRIHYHDVTSSNIKGLYFDAKGKVAYVEFLGGRRFAYSMSKEMFDAMRDAKSIGSYFARNVKSACPVVWSGFRCDNSPCTEDATLLGTIAGNGPVFRACDACSKIPRFTGVVFAPLQEKKP
jgi:hypothetical protein